MKSNAATLNGSCDRRPSDLSAIVPETVEYVARQLETGRRLPAFEFPEEMDIGLVDFAGRHGRLKARVCQVRKERLLGRSRGRVGERGEEGKRSPGKVDVIGARKEDVGPEVKLVTGRSTITR